MFGVGMAIAGLIALFLGMPYLGMTLFIFGLLFAMEAPYARREREEEKERRRGWRL